MDQSYLYYVIGWTIKLHHECGQGLKGFKMSIGQLF